MYGLLFNLTVFFLRVTYSLIRKAIICHYSEGYVNCFISAILHLQCHLVLVFMYPFCVKLHVRGHETVNNSLYIIYANPLSFVSLHVMYSYYLGLIARDNVMLHSCLNFILFAWLACFKMHMEHFVLYCATCLAADTAAFSAVMHPLCLLFSVPAFWCETCHFVSVLFFYFARLILISFRFMICSVHVVLC